MPGRTLAFAILPLAAALSSCARDATEDPAIAAPGAGIPIGAVGAVGVSFDAPSSSSRAEAPPPPRAKPRVGLRAVPAPPPLDPFADPPGDTAVDGGAGPAPRPPRSHQPRGTTL